MSLDGRIIVASAGGYLKMSDGVNSHDIKRKIGNGTPLVGEFIDGKPAVTFISVSYSSERPYRDLVHIVLENGELKEEVIPLGFDWFFGRSLSNFSAHKEGNFRYQATSCGAGTLLIDRVGNMKKAKDKKIICSDSDGKRTIAGIVRAGQIIEFDNYLGGDHKIIGNVFDPKKIILENGNVYVSDNKNLYSQQNGRFEPVADTEIKKAFACVEHKGTLYVAFGEGYHTGMIAVSDRKANYLMATRGRCVGINYFERLNGDEALIGTGGGVIYSVELDKLKDMKAFATDPYLFNTLEEKKELTPRVVGGMVHEAVLLPQLAC